MGKKDQGEMPEELANQPCPICHKNSLTLTEKEIEVPYFGKVYVFSMTCGECKFHKADVECAEQKDPCMYTFEIANQQDMDVRVVKSSEATVKLPGLCTITPGPAAQGYITNIEGMLQRVKEQIESLKKNAEDEDEEKKAEQQLQKIEQIIQGKEKQQLIVEDPTGNSAIVSDKVVRKSLKK